MPKSMFIHAPHAHSGPWCSGEGRLTTAQSEEHDGGGGDPVWLHSGVWKGRYLDEAVKPEVEHAHHGGKQGAQRARAEEIYKVHKER